MDPLMVYFSVPSAALERFLPTKTGPTWNQIQIPVDANYDSDVPPIPDDWDSSEPFR